MSLLFVRILFYSSLLLTIITFVYSQVILILFLSEVESSGIVKGAIVAFLFSFLNGFICFMLGDFLSTNKANIKTK